MSTRSRIGVELQDGTVKSIYCHHDGYIEGVGEILKTCYTDPKVVEQLVELGDISSLYDTVEDTAPHSYHQWRGEDTPPREDESCFDFWRNAFRCGEEFAYLFGEYDGVYQWLVKEETYPRPLDNFKD